jgi:transcriptional regulator with XRE-family HTH domain
MAQNDDVREWVKAMMDKARMKQDDLAEILGLSQASVSSRLIAKADATPFKLPEIELLEDHFGELSPIRYAPSRTTVASGVDPVVLRAVMRHLAKEYSGIIAADPDKFSDAVLALCEYVQENDKQLTRAESMIAMRAIAAAND